MLPHGNVKYAPFAYDDVTMNLSFFEERRIPIKLFGYERI